MNLLERIKKLAKERDISIYQLEEKIDIGRNTIYQWNKRTPSADKLQKVADYFNVSTDYLLGRTDDKAIKSYTSETMSTVNKIIKSDNPIFMELIEKLSVLNDEELKVLNSMADSLIALK